MQRGTTELDRELPVKLTEHEIAERGETIAAKMLRVKTLRKKRREDLRSINAQIEAELDTVQSIAETIMGGVEARKQGDLFVSDEVVPSQGEAAAALAEVAERVEPVLYHRDGAICRKDPCKRRHLSAEQLDKAGIVREGKQPFEPSEAESDPRPKCSACGTVLTAMEVVKKLGLCETCQVEGEPVGIFEHEEQYEERERELLEEGVELPATRVE
jgi:hypothetical protein